LASFIPSDVYHSFGRIEERAPRARVYDPNVTDPEGQIVINSFLHVFHAVASRKNLDAKKRRLVQDWRARQTSGDNGDIGHSKPVRLHLHTLLGHHHDAPLGLAIQQITDQKGL
jgi:hypothetical protein